MEERDLNEMELEKLLELAYFQTTYTIISKRVQWTIRSEQYEGFSDHFEKAANKKKKNDSARIFHENTK